MKPDAKKYELLDAAEKERYIFQLLNSGLTASEIAENLGISKTLVTFSIKAKIFRDAFGKNFDMAGVELDTTTAYKLSKFTNLSDVENIIKMIKDTPNKKKEIINGVREISNSDNDHYGKVSSTTFGAYCNEARELQGLSLDDAAARLNTSVKLINLIETGIGKLTLDYFYKCLELYGQNMNVEQRLAFTLSAIQQLGKIDLDLSKITIINKDYLQRFLASMLLNEPIPSDMCDPLNTQDRIKGYIAGSCIDKMAIPPEKKQSSIKGFSRYQWEIGKVVNDVE
jgi:transcriptional regulator with XRE-family HTH domain